MKKSNFFLNRKLNFCCLIIAFFSCNFSCGFYTFSGSTLPGHIRTVAIPMFGNRTSEFGVREEITDALTDQFTKDNTLKVVDRRIADSLIRGEIINIRDQAGAYNQEEKVSEIRVYVIAAAAFEDIKKHNVFWEEQITQWGTYNPDGVVGQDNTSREDAIKEAIDKIVADIFNKTIAGW